MKTERTPEEAARAKRTNANVMIAVGAVTAACALAGALIILGGRGDVPDWLFGGKPAARAPAGNWPNAAPRVAFQDWGPAPFERARREGRLVLLFLGPTYNAATARMLAGTFADARVGALVEDRFVPVRVRSEDFPDLDRRYRAGGWPTTALLLPDGVVLDAGTSMPPEIFERWAASLADKAAKHPDALARAEADAAAARKRSAAELGRGATPPTADEAAEAARPVLLDSWDPGRRTFDARGPRFPRFERVAALAALDPAWAKTLAGEAARGDLAFQDQDGGFFRAANPDGTPAALEKTAGEQAAALDALCALQPDAARRELEFLSRDFVPKGPPAWRGWLAGWALDAKRDTASDGPEFARFSAEGWREAGAARRGDSAELSRAVLECAAADPARKAFARRALARTKDGFARAARRRDPRLLLDDAAALGAALLAAGDVAGAAGAWRWMEAELSAGPAFYDRRATGILPPEADRLAVPELNARALRFVRRLAAALPPGPDRAAASKRAESLFFWLSARSSALDPAVWAALAAEEPR